MRKTVSLLLSAICIFAVIFSGCGSPKTIEENLSSLLSSSASKAETTVAESSKAESGSAASAEYTMSDIYKLKNTENFARNTLEHIFDGTINSKGKATGYHYTKVSGSKGEIIEGTKSKEDKNGVFTGKVKVNNIKKNGFSSFYPESWSPQQVVDAINTAYDYAINDSKNPKGSLWIGYYDDLEIDMYLDKNKKITTAFPVYEGD